VGRNCDYIVLLNKSMLTKVRYVLSRGKPRLFSLLYNSECFTMGNIMLEKILLLSKKFIAIRSIPANPHGLEEILELALDQLKGFTVDRFERNGVKSALVYVADTRPEKFDILLSCHLDVIPGKEEQYVPRIEGDKLYGVGSMDMKANAACVIEVFKEVAKQVDYTVGLQFGTDEETGGFDGVKYQVEEGVRADFILASEPTNFDIVNKSKGILWLKIKAKGKTTHGAYPWRGDNAIWKMNNFLNKLGEVYPNPTKKEWVTTINLSTIESSNVVYNKVPDDCVIGLDIRFIPEDADTILGDIKRLIPEGFNVEILADEPVMYADKDNTYLTLLSKTGKEVLEKDLVIREAQGSSDARHFTPVGGVGIEFGPIGEDIGGDNEYVSISSLEQYCKILKKFLLSVKK
jgi:succinyl-diaminopimelate desuccinylase